VVCAASMADNREQIERRMDELAREYAKTHDPRNSSKTLPVSALLLMCSSMPLPGAAR
jgi:hypothetical protein